MGIRTAFSSWIQHETGQDIAEYTILLGLIAIVVMVAAQLLGQSLARLFQAMADLVGNLL